MKKCLLALIALLGLLRGAQGQLIQTGQWRTHLSYKNALICESSKRYVYAASSQGFFRVMMNYSDMEKLGKDEGFANNEVTALAYDVKRDLLLIGYSDGNIDLLQNDRIIFNIPGFKNKLLQGDKRILSASFHENEALISTYFGLLVVDMDNYEINDSYSSIGPNGTAIPVLSSAVVGDSIYIGTERGLRFAKWSNSVNLNDYTQWQWAIENNRAAKNLTPYNGTLLFELDSMVYQWNKGMSLFLPDKRFIARIWNNEFGTHIARQGEILTLNGSGNKKETINLVSGITQFKDGLFWFCTGIGPGVIKKDPAGEIAFMPDGPADPSIFRMTQNAPEVLASAGGVSSTFGNAFNNAGFYLYTQYGWKNNLSSPFNTNMYDFTYVQYIKSRNWYLAATHSNGILVIKDGVVINRFDETNSPLKRQPPINLIKVSGIAEDSKGNIWIASFGSDEPLFCYTKSGVWKIVNVPAACREVRDFSIDYLDRKWMILQTGGIQVFDEGKSIDAASDDRSIYIGTQQGLISPEVLSIKCDELGYTWIGTNQGLNVYSGSSSLFVSPKVDRYIVEQDGDVGYLMGEETINDICVDGGGRKWMATNNGLFLVDAYGQRVIKHFDSDNSPLLSNRIICIGQNNLSGEIFAGTDRGIVSYRSDASEAAEMFDKIKVYPNPVPPKYDGLIAIEGLTSNAEIKITDITGKLVYQTKANGGKATWNGLRMDGSRPNSGVLFVFAINTDGSETAMGKFIYVQGNP
jgi:ligand-binding sensor domain-containing protein